MVTEYELAWVLVLGMALWLAFVVAADHTL
jgi:hypothetical protein